MRRIAAVAMLVALISALLGVTGAVAQDSSGEDEKVVFRVGNSNDIDGFNPFKIVEIPSYELMGLTYDLLVENGPKDSGPVPGLADSWETSDDGLTWTFHLNEDAKWHDGKPVTSEDVAYTYQRILDEEQGLYIDAVKQIESIETPDEHTVVFRTKEPSVQMLNTYVYILPKHIWEDVPADETKSFKNEPVIGSGPFQAVEWKEGQFARLETNPDYFRGSPAIDEIIFQFYDNEDTMVQALKNGDVDYIANMPVNLFKSLENQEGIETNSAPDPGITQLGFNLYEPTPEAIEEFDAPETTTGNPALLDPLVRESINWAIDEEELTDKILQGEGVPVFDTLALLDSIRWVNPIPAGLAAESKLRQLRLATEVGLSIPPTVVGNDPARIRDLFTRLDGNMITKLLGPLSQTMDASGDFVYTNRVTAQDMAHIDDVQYAPQIFQALIDKKRELRVVLVGRHTFVGAIDASRTDQGRVDWRRLTTRDDVRWTEGSLPAAVEQATRRLMQRLGLCFGAADFLVDAEDRHIFLELNPAGEWGWLQRDLGFPIAEAIAETLLSPSMNG